MGVPRPGVESELQLPAYTTATATLDPSCIYKLYHSSQQHRILNPLSEVRDRTCNLMVPSRICFCCATMGTPYCFYFILFLSLVGMFVLFLFLSFRATPAPFGSSQARGRIRATATAVRDPSCVCDLHHSSWQRWILNPLSEARDRTRNLTVPSRICFCCAMMGTPAAV